jgi:hypothetical protein
MRIVKVLGFVLSTSILSCGGPPAPAPSAAAVPPSNAARGATAPPDTTPVAPPPKMTAVVTLKNAEALQKNVRDLASSAFPILQSLTVDAAAQTFLGTALADVVDLSKPIDVAFLDTNAFAVSLALASIDDAKQNLAEDFDLVPREDGVIALAPRKSGDRPNLHCEIRPASGASPYRLVCATHTAPLRALGPYLARTVPRNEAPDDLRIDVAAPSLALNLGTSDAPTPMEADLRKLASDTLADIGALSLDATLGTDEIGLRAKTVFRSSRSSLTRIATTHARDAKPLPDLFWRLPADSLGAFYARGAEVADLAPLKSWLLETIDASARAEGGSNELVESSKKVLSSLFLTGGPVSVAYGLDVPNAIAAISNATVKNPVPRTAFHGWLLVGLEEPSSRWVEGLKASSALDRSLWEKSALERHKTERETFKVREEPPTDPKLPPHTAHFVARQSRFVRGKSAPATTLSLHVYVVPDGNRTWLAMGENDSQVLAKVNGVLAATPEAVLASRTDLQALHVPTGFAGFVTAGFFDAIRGPDDAAAPTKARELLDALSASPAVEGAPISFVVPTSAATGGASEGGGEVELQVRAPRGVAKALLSRSR